MPVPSTDEVKLNLFLGQVIDLGPIDHMLKHEGEQHEATMNLVVPLCGLDNGGPVGRPI